MAVDIVSENRILTLHPAIRGKALVAYRESVQKTPKGVHPFISEGLRTFARSDELWRQGRTTKGPIVTNSKGGQSYHNYGLALDFVIQVNGLPKWTVNNDWMTVVNAFKKQGFTWGGDWKTIKDFPHLEINFGLNWRELLKRYNDWKVDANGYVIL